jgi:hypothetical protein
MVLKARFGDQAKTTTALAFCMTTRGRRLAAVEGPAGVCGGA